ncbi:hypothetical protein SB396_32225, partial [Burkholderia cenocepacia]
KKSRQDLIEQFFDTRSWTRVEGMKADLLKQAYEDMRVHLEEKFSDAPSHPVEGSDTPPEQEAA